MKISETKFSLQTTTSSTRNVDFLLLLMWHTKEEKPCTSEAFDECDFVPE